MIKSEVVVNASLLRSISHLYVVGWHLPANSVFLHLPFRTFGPIPEIPGFDNVLLERSGNLPLVVIMCGRRGGDVAARQHLSRVGEDLGSPPLELSVLGRREATNKRLACDN